eukprot:556330-Rhodomonas_salina.2
MERKAEFSRKKQDNTVCELARVNPTRFKTEMEHLADGSLGEDVDNADTVPFPARFRGLRLRLFAQRPCDTPLSSTPALEPQATQPELQEQT